MFKSESAPSISKCHKTIMQAIDIFFKKDTFKVFSQTQQT